MAGLSSFRELFDSVAFSKAFAARMPELGLDESTGGTTIKLQLNKGKGGCFPMHFDNPGPPNQRALTAIMYLNDAWRPGAVVRVMRTFDACAYACAGACASHPHTQTRAYTHTHTHTHTQATAVSWSCSPYCGKASWFRPCSGEWLCSCPTESSTGFARRG